MEACGTLLNPEAPGSYKIIYSTMPRVLRTLTPNLISRMLSSQGNRISQDSKVGRGAAVPAESV